MVNAIGRAKSLLRRINHDADSYSTALLTVVTAVEGLIQEHGQTALKVEA
jgi:hypothetical protein